MKNKIEVGDVIYSEDYDQLAIVWREIPNVSGVVMDYIIQIGINKSAIGYADEMVLISKGDFK